MAMVHYNDIDNARLRYDHEWNYGEGLHYVFFVPM